MKNRARRNTRGNHEPAYRWAATLPEPCSPEHYQLLLPLRSQPHFARPPRALSAYSRVTTHLFPTRSRTKTRRATRVHDAPIQRMLQPHDTLRFCLFLLVVFKAGLFRGEEEEEEYRVVEYRNKGKGTTTEKKDRRTRVGR